MAQKRGLRAMPVRKKRRKVDAIPEEVQEMNRRLDRVKKLRRQDRLNFLVPTV